MTIDFTKPLPPGVYQLGTSALVIPDGATLRCAGCTFKGATSDGPIIRPGNFSSMIGDLGTVVDGGSIYADGGKHGILIDSVRVTNVPNKGIWQSGGLGFVQCHDITARNILVDHAPFASTLSDCSNVLFDRIENTAVNYGNKWDGSGTNWTMRGLWSHDNPNDFMAMEWQGAPINVLIEDFLVERIGYGPNQSDNDHSLLLSIPADKGSNITIRKGSIAGRRPKDDAGGRWSDGHPVAIEAGGDNFLTEDVLIDGAGWAVSVTDMAGTCSGTVRNNLIRNVWEQVNLSSSTQKVQQSNNGPSVVLTWTIDQLRAAVGRYGPQPTPPMPPLPPVTLYPNAFQATFQDGSMARYVIALKGETSESTDAAPSSD